MCLGGVIKVRGEKEREKKKTLNHNVLSARECIKVFRNENQINESIRKGKNGY